VAAGVILPYVTARTSSPNAVRHESLFSRTAAQPRPDGVVHRSVGIRKSSVAMLVAQKLLEEPRHMFSTGTICAGLNAGPGSP
jgi:bifunctional enzyme CysN/CysC